MINTCISFVGLLNLNRTGLRISNGAFNLKNYMRHYSNQEDLFHLLKELTGCSDAKAKKTAGLKKLKNYDEGKLRESYATLRSFGFSNEDIDRNVGLLVIHTSSLKNRFMIFEETGLKKSQINPSILKGFYTIMKSTPKSLKEQGLFNNDVNIIDNYSVMLGLPAEFRPALVEDNVIAFYHLSFLKNFLKWKSGGIWKDEKPLPNRIHFKSIRLISMSFDLLVNDFRLPIERVCNFPLLLATYPEKLEEILNNISNLGGDEFIDIIHRWPKIVMNRCDSILKIHQYLKDFGVSKEAAIKTPAIYTLHPDNVYQRLQYMTDNPTLCQWLYHPQVLRTVLYYNKFSSRLAELQDANMKCLSLHLLQCNDKQFKKHIEQLDKSNHYDILGYLSKELAVEEKILRKKLKKHPYCLFIPHKDIMATFLFLKQQGFTNEEILSNIIIILYPKEAVEDELNKVNSRPGCESCRISPNGDLRRETILPLVLYFLEKPFHFSKDGIWYHRNQNSQEVMSLSTSDS